MIQTRLGVPLGSDLVSSYFRNLVNMFFKILPMKENGEMTLDVYMESMMAELLGSQSLVPELSADAMFASLLFILQGLIDNPTWSHQRVRREVFRAISICNKMRSRYGGESNG